MIFAGSVERMDGVCGIGSQLTDPRINDLANDRKKKWAHVVANVMVYQVYHAWYGLRSVR